jgi:hypothetical protein
LSAPTESGAVNGMKVANNREDKGFVMITAQQGIAVNIFLYHTPL